MTTQIDALIESVRATIEAVEKSLREANAENLPKGAVEAIEKSLVDLRKTWEDLVDLSFKSGLEKDLPIDPPLQLKKSGD